MGWRGRAQRPWCRSPGVLRAVFFVLVRNNPSLRIASASQRIPVGPARRFPLTPSDERHTNAYGCHESPFEPSIDSLIHRQEAKERPSVGWVRGDNGKPRRHPSPGYSPANGTGTAMTSQGEDMSPEPIRRKGRKTLAKIYDSLTDPEEAADRSRIIGLPTKKEAHDIRDELTAAAWVGGKSVSRIRTAKEYISIAESFFRKLRAIKNTETRTPQTGIPTPRELLRDTRVTNLDEYERMIETASADTEKST